MAIPEHGAKVNSYQPLEHVPSLSLDSFEEGWLESGSKASLVEHPLMRGLLMELPPKGAQPSPEWMNRWFEAARAVLDLIYVPR